MFGGMTDDDLMKLFSNCSMEAFNHIYERNKLTLTNYIKRTFLLNCDSAQDIAQETLIKVYENKFKYNTDSHFCVWLYTIARNLAINEIKHNNKILDHADSDNFNENIYYDNNTSSNTSVDVDRKVSVVKSEILKLNEKYREILILRYIDNMSLEEIQLITGKNLNTIKSLLKRGLEKLKDNLKLLDFEDI